jgi:hypothetical protein
MIKIEFTAEQIKELHFERFNHPHPRVQLKMEILYLQSQNLPPPQISQLTGVCEATVRTYLKEYQEGGIEALKVVKFRRQESELYSPTHQVNVLCKSPHTVRARFVAHLLRACFCKTSS